MGPSFDCFVMQSHADLGLKFGLKSLSNLELINLQNKVAAEVQTRLLASDSDIRSTSSYTVIDPPASSFSTQRSCTGLLTPFSCGYKCKWCEAECTRREGHTHHSCYNCRRRRA